MDVAKSNSCYGSFAKTCVCYKAATLNETILDANEISDLKDWYVLGEQLGWGQFGIIRTCTDKVTGEVLACKSIAKGRLVTAEDVRSIRLEIEIMTRLSGHRNVVDLKAVYEDEDFVHLVMELCAGGELYNQLEKHGRFCESEARGLFRHLMQVVSFCHENGIVHRDLKPENILLATKSSLSQIKLADFGLATYIKPGQKLQGTVGSPFYIAPEVLTGGYDQAADVWSAGVILYILLSGMPPFWGKTKSKIFDAVRTADLQFPTDPWKCISESAKDLVKRMLHTDISQRLTAQQILEHSWMEDDAYPKESNARADCSIGNLVDLGTAGASFSSSFICRSQDISFSAGSNMVCADQSSVYACKSSFSAFIAEPSTACFQAGGFSFQSDGGCKAMDSPSLIPSMPSFEFFSPVPVTEQENCSLELSTNVPTVDIIFRDVSIETEQKVIETKRGNGTTGSRVSGIHNKRNRTIGVGEREALDTVVTESVIRWSSCTLLPTSLRSSLVC